MSLTSEQEDVVRTTAIEMFGEESVKEMDKLFFEFHDLRLTCKDNYDFLKIVKDKHGENGIQIVAALLYGMKLGELGREYAYRQEQAKKAPLYGHAA